MNNDGWDISSIVPYRIARVNAVLSAQVTAALKSRCGLSLGQWRILAVVGMQGAQTSREICDRLKFDPALISRLIHNLAGEGLLATARRPGDRRILHVSLTEAGQALFDSTFPVTEEMHARLLMDFEPGEHAELLRLIDKLDAAVVEPEAEAPLSVA